jgi:hypothetical protein
MVANRVSPYKEDNMPGLSSALGSVTNELAKANSIGNGFMPGTNITGSDYASYLGEIQDQIEPGYSTSSSPPIGNPGSLGAAIGSFLGTIGTPLTGLLGGSFDPNKNALDAANAGDSIQKGVANTGAFLDIITDVPRVLTITIGIIMLGAGLFMLGARPVVNIIEKTRGALP